MGLEGTTTTGRTNTGCPALYAATVPIALMAGLFFAWDVSVMPGLARVDATSYVPVMAELIAAIENPAFHAVLLATLVLPAVAAVTERRRGHRRASSWVVAALVCYLAAMLVTAVVHLPLNDALVAAAAPGSGVEPASARAAFEQPWRAGNVVRTLACSAALLCLVRALSLGGRGCGRTDRHDGPTGG